MTIHVVPKMPLGKRHLQTRGFRRGLLVAYHLRFRYFIPYDTLPIPQNHAMHVCF